MPQAVWHLTQPEACLFPMPNLLDGGITVSELTVRSSEELVARFAIAANAPVGFRQIQVRKANAQVSNPVPFEIRPAGSAPRILSQSQNTTIEYAETARLEVFAAGTGSLTYQWYAGFAGLTDVPIVGATNRTYVTDQLTTTTSFWVRVRNANGVADSQTITVTVNPPEAATFGFSQLLYIPGVEQLLVFSATDALYLAQLYYDPIVSVNLKDQTGTTLINAPNQHFAFFRALPAEQGETYTLKSHHCLDIFHTVIVTPPNDFRYDDEFNFSEMQSDQVYSDGFIWLAEGPQVLTVEQRLCLGFTTDQQTAAGCSNLQITSMFPSTLIRGTLPEVEFKGNCLKGVKEEHIAIFAPDGKQTTSVRVTFITEKSPDGTTLKAKFNVDKDAPLTTSLDRYKAVFTVPESPPSVEILFEVTDRTLEIQRFRTVPEKGKSIVSIKNKGLAKVKVRLEVKSDKPSSGKARIVSAKHLQEFDLEPGRVEPVTLAGEMMSEKLDDVTLRLMESNPGSGGDYLHDEKAFSVVRFLVSEVGFAGGHQMLLWERKGEPLLNDGQTTNWIRDGADNGVTAKAAYNFNNDQNVDSQQVKVFVRLTTVPSGIIFLDDTKATLRASLKKSPQSVVLGAAEEMVFESPNIKTQAFILDRKKFESGRQGVKLGRYVFDWEISFEKDGLGNNIWTPLGDRFASDKTQTGPHTIYWTYRNPIPNPFTDSLGGIALPNMLYDKALEWGCGFVAGGLDDDKQPDQSPIENKVGIIDRVTNGIGGKVRFQIVDSGFTNHPLELTRQLRGGSSNHATLLGGILQSLGVMAKPEYVWNGNRGFIYRFIYIPKTTTGPEIRQSVTFQLRRPSNDAVNADPHFPYFTYVRILEKDISEIYDPAYGDFDGASRDKPKYFKYLAFKYFEYMDEHGELHVSNQNGFDIGTTGDVIPINIIEDKNAICIHSAKSGKH